MNVYRSKDRKVSIAKKEPYIAKTSESTYFLDAPDNCLSRRPFCFQGCHYRLVDAIEILNSNRCSRVELFPGVYIEYKYNTIWRNIYHLIHRRSSINIIIENKKDRVLVAFIDNVDISDKCRSYVTVEEEVDPMCVVQPEALGGGHCGGCEILRFFERLGLCGMPSFSSYYFFSDKSLLEATRFDKKFLDLCKKNRCYELYTSIEKNGYSRNLPKEDKIYVEINNGRYIAREGKHRICAMKRFGYIGKVPMIVTQPTDTDNVERELDELIYKKRDISTLRTVVEDCYRRYEALGIPREIVRGLIKIPNATVLDYLEKSSYTFEQLYDLKLPWAQT